MYFTTLVKGLGSTDAKQVQRDSFLIWMIGYPLVIALALRLLVPIIADALVDYVDLTAYYIVIVGYLCILVTPTLTGTVAGFLLLDERDEHTLQALLVTPVPLTSYLAYRVAVPVLLSVLLTLLVVPLTGLMRVSLVSLLPVALVASFYAPMMMLFLGAFAENKVQGVALMKITGTLGMIPVVAYFVPAPWQDLAGLIFPPYLPVKAFWVAETGGTGYWLYLLAGLVLQLGVLALFVRRFHQTVYR